MSILLRFGTGLALCAGTWWLVLRPGAGTRPPWRVPWLATALDVLPIVAGLGVALAATARPLLAGLVIAALAAGLSLADRVKRVVLDEPVVFADRAELVEVVRHPSLYLPFTGSAWLLTAIAAAIAALGVLLVWAEPPVWHRSVAAAGVEALAAVALVYGCMRVAGAPPLVHRLAAAYTRHLHPSREPAQDAAALGPCASLIVHATLAAAERPARRLAAVEQAAGLTPIPAQSGPIVLIQAESFFDPARLDPTLASLLPHFATLSREAVVRGSLDVRVWGANTMRSEFAALTGIPEAPLGLDRFNPYEAFAQTAGPPLPSLARAAQAAGYRTVFVHPFDLSFYARDRVMPLLGFDELVGQAAFHGAPRRGGWVSDEAVGAVVNDVVALLGPRVFVFAATMEAHGPWAATARPGESVALPEPLRVLPEAAQLAQYLWHLQGMDRMLHAVATAMATQGSGWLALYGDHQPSLPAAFAAAGFTDRRSDYLIWSASQRGEGRAADLPVEGLGTALTAAMAEAWRRS